MIFNTQTLNETIDDKVKEIIFKDEKDLFKWMKSNIGYDWNSKSLKSHDQVMQDKSGNCHDQVMFELEELKRLGLSPKAMFLIEYNNEGKGNTAVTHSFVYWKNKNNKYVWFENAWQDQAGLKEFDSLQNLKQSIIDSHNKGEWGNNNQYPEIEFANFGSHDPGESLSELVDKCLEESVVYESIFVSTLHNISEVNNNINANIAYNESFLDMGEYNAGKIEGIIIKDMLSKYKDIFAGIYVSFHNNQKALNIINFQRNFLPPNVVYCPTESVLYNGILYRYRNITHMRTGTTMKLEIDKLLSILSKVARSDVDITQEESSCLNYSNEKFLWYLRHLIVNIQDYDNDIKMSIDDSRMYYIKNLLMDFFRERIGEDIVVDSEVIKNMTREIKTFDPNSDAYKGEINYIIDLLDDYIDRVRDMSESSNYELYSHLVFLITKKIGLVLQTYAELYAMRYDMILEYYNMIIDVVTQTCKIEGGNK